MFVKSYFCLISFVLSVATLYKVDILTRQRVEFINSEARPRLKLNTQQFNSSTNAQMSRAFDNTKCQKLSLPIDCDHTRRECNNARDIVKALIRRDCRSPPSIFALFSGALGWSKK